MRWEYMRVLVDSTHLESPIESPRSRRSVWYLIYRFPANPLMVTGWENWGRSSVCDVSFPVHRKGYHLSASCRNHAYEWYVIQLWCSCIMYILSHMIHPMCRPHRGCNATAKHTKLAFISLGLSFQKYVVQLQPGTSHDQRKIPLHHFTIGFQKQGICADFLFLESNGKMVQWDFSLIIGQNQTCHSNKCW